MGTAKTNIQDVKLNHRKCPKAHSGIVSGRQGLGQARTLARRLYKKGAPPAKADAPRRCIFPIRFYFTTILRKFFFPFLRMMPSPANASFA